MRLPSFCHPRLSSREKVQNIAITFMIVIKWDLYDLLNVSLRTECTGTPNKSTFQ